MFPFFPCRCKFGIKITGTKTTDVICNDVKHTDADASPTPGRASTDQPRERVQIQTLLTTATTTMTTPRRNPYSATSSPSRTANPVGKALPPPSARPWEHQNKHEITAGLRRPGFLVTFATVGLLVLTAVIIKLYIIFYLEKHESVQSMSHHSKEIHWKCETFLDNRKFYYKKIQLSETSGHEPAFV